MKKKDEKKKPVDTVLVVQNIQHLFMATGKPQEDKKNG